MNLPPGGTLCPVAPLCGNDEEDEEDDDEEEEEDEEKDEEDAEEAAALVCTLAASAGGEVVAWAGAPSKVIPSPCTTSSCVPPASVVTPSAAL